MSTVRYLLICFAVISLSACATVNRGVVETFRIDSVPQGAKVTLVTDNLRSVKSSNRSVQVLEPKTFICPQTPCAIPLARKRKFVAKVEFEGYEPFETYVSSGFSSGAAAGNAVLTTSTSVGSGVAAGALSGAIAGPTFGAILLPFGTEAVSTFSGQLSSSLITSGAQMGLGVGVGLTAIDLGSGSNLNFSPNPVVVGLAQAGKPVAKDPMVPLFNQKIENEILVARWCNFNRVKLREKHKEECKAARQKLSESTEAFKKTRNAVIEARKEIRKQLREQQAQGVDKLTTE